MIYIRDENIKKCNECSKKIETYRTEYTKKFNKKAKYNRRPNVITNI